MKIYLAAQYHLKADIAAKAAQLEELGHEVSSTWHKEDIPAGAGLEAATDKTWAEYAQRDLDEIFSSNMFIVFTVDPNTPTRRGGRHVETGFALSRPSIICAIVGLRENIFHYLPWVKQFDTWEGALECLTSKRPTETAS